MIRCSTHWSTVPESAAWGRAGPVEKITFLPCFMTLCRRSVMPGRSSRWYTRPCFHPSRGLIWSDERCHETCTGPATGESTILLGSPLSVPPPLPSPPAPPISSISSSNRITASPLKSARTAPDSGRVTMMRGGNESGGPPGGTAMFAHPAQRED